MYAFRNAIKSTTSGTPGTGAFTSSAAATGFLDWSTVYSGWMGLVRYEDGSNWELSYSYWNGTTLSRGTNQLVASSSGSVLTLTSAATATMVPDAFRMAPMLGCGILHGWMHHGGNTIPQAIGHTSPTVTGTAGQGSIDDTSFYNAQPRNEATSATTANSVAGWSNSSATVGIAGTTAGRGGMHMATRWGASAIPTGPRFAIGLSSSSFVAQTVDPSAYAWGGLAFAKDAADTNLQLMSGDTTSTHTKVDTGIAVAAGAWFESHIWWEPGEGSTKGWGLLMRMDTGDIWRGSVTTHISGGALKPEVAGSLNGTNTGTALVMGLGSMFIYAGI